VYKGTVLSRHEIGELGTPVHAPTSGRVSAVGVAPVHGGHGEVLLPCVHIEADGHDAIAPDRPQRPDISSLSPADIRHGLLEGGICGLGGAMFPAATKLNPITEIDTLIINGAECEPFINCDDALIQSRPQSILQGAQLMMRALQHTDHCIVAIKRDMRAAIETMDAAIKELADDRFILRPVPDAYPVGGERQLIQLLCKREVPSGGLPWDAGAVVQNMGTAAAVSDYLHRGEPLISRMVSVTGAGVREPCNIVARIGTSISDLVEAAGGYTDQAEQLCAGGPMMGAPLSTDQLPIGKNTNCILVSNSTELGTPPPEMPCIQCSLCHEACPAGLMPQQLFAAARHSNLDLLKKHALTDCIECGCCDFVCPSGLPLTPSFVRAKSELWADSFKRQRAEHARKLFNQRNVRLQRKRIARQKTLDSQLEGVDSADETSADALDALKRRIDQRTGSKD
ncbi:MAG: electron transport complex subunit RsxC, partial [Gammaproteobacteria bacterium]